MVFILDSFSVSEFISDIIHALCIVHSGWGHRESLFAGSIMAAAVLHKNYGWQRLYIFCISYFLIRGLSPPTASNDLNNVSNSFYAGKIISSPQLSSTLLKAKNKTTEISTTMKLAKLSRLVQYWSLASLLLLLGDICPNPGWASSVLNSRGLKIAHLNI